MRPQTWADDDGTRRPVLVQRFPAGWRAVSSALLGGGIGPRGWWLNAQVSKEYFHPDPVAHARAIAASLGLAGDGVAMLTAADASRFRVASDVGVEAVATVGLGFPVPASAEAVEPSGAGTAVAQGDSPGTINIMVTVPVALSDAALVNAVLTATEAKTQALIEAGVPGTGTSSDAICIACPATGPEDPEPYGGPRSRWGARIARAVHAVVAAGTEDWVTVHPPGDPHRYGDWRPIRAVSSDHNAR
jgi:adenosylcobinamide amidohydrolase